MEPDSALRPGTRAPATARSSSSARARSARAACALLGLAVLAPGCPAANGRATPAAPASGAANPRAQDPRDRDATLAPLGHGTVVLETARGTWVIDVELARTPEERARGLMWRRDLPQDHGMLFLFEEDRAQSFWMHNTLVALDMIHLDVDRRVVGVVAHAEPRTDTPRGVGKPARFVLEVGAGEAAAHAVGPGVQARFLGVAE